MAEIPFGQKESETLEFMGRDALKDLFSIGREVVAMLNAGGGEIWVGVRETQGRAVLVEGIERPELERQRLRDYLVDSMEPHLSSEEIGVEEVVDEEGQVILRLSVSPRDANRSYALLKQSARYFLKRFGDRLRLMSREEILRQHGSDLRGQARSPDEEARSARTAASQSAQARLWLRVAPVESVAIDLPNPELSSRLRTLLTNPDETGNRRTGLTFVAFTTNEKKELRQDRLVGGDGEYSQTEIAATGVISSWVNLRSLLSTSNGDGRPILNAWYLMEYPTSVLRLARKIYQDPALAAARVDRLLVDFAIFGLAGQRLKPGSPFEWGLERRSELFQDGDDFQVVKPLEVTLDELANGDRVAFRLMRQLYAAFGFSEADIPREFDRKTGRLVLPE